VCLLILNVHSLDHSHGVDADFLLMLGRERASLPGFKVLPLRQFGTWGPVMADEYDPQKDTYVLVSSLGRLKWPQYAA
jgi:hypothetical protein